ncbi:MAG: hypothetical protein K0R51_972 [Cytophagaceae bacterium]|nr:hypothetical protein [Cytophagaceae bacterium]
MKKIDLSKKHKAYYSALDRPELVEVEAAAFLCIQGKGDPSSEEFRQCKLREKDFVVAKLEGLWSYDKTKYASISMEEAPTRIPRADWTYTLMIRIPEFVTRQDLHQALEVARMKKKIAFEQEIKRVEIPAHRAVQILHKGSFDKEPESLQEISSFMKEHAFQQGGQHHEIYLSDFRKTVPDKLRTILREPIK